MELIGLGHSQTRMSPSIKAEHACPAQSKNLIRCHRRILYHPRALGRRFVKAGGQGKRREGTRSRNRNVGGRLSILATLSKLVLDD
jgi:hypothetical protein